MAFDAGLMPPRPRRSPYAPAQSLQFSAAAGDYLTRTPAVATPDRTRGIFVFAMKPSRSLLPSTLERLFIAGNTSIMRGGGEADGRGYLSFGHGGYYKYTTTALFRDPTAFLLGIVSLDTNATATNRVWFYRGLERIPTTVGSEFSSGETVNFGNTVPHYIGYDGTYNFDGVLSDVRWLPGVSLQNGDYAPEGFFEVDNSGGLNLIRPATSGYGTNGFYLDGEISGGLALDKSGNGNHWTAVNGVSVSSDVPGDKASADLGNYARINPLHSSKTQGSLHTASTISEAGLLITMPGSASAPAYHYSTIPIPASGKWYFEGEVVASVSGVFYHFIAVGESYPAGFTAQYRSNGASPAGSPVWTTVGNIVGCKIDCDGGSIQFVDRNGNDAGSAISFSPSGRQFISFGANSDQTGATAKLRANFGQHPWTYTPPTGFKPLCTAHLPPKAPKNPGAQIGVLTWVGDGTNDRLIPWDQGNLLDFVWGKSRTSTAGHVIHDRVRGNDKVLQSNAISAEGAGTGYFSFDPAGFRVSYTGSLGATAEWNHNTQSYVAWCIGGLKHMTAPEIAALVTATGATITPSAIAYDATLGMAIITYTGNNTAGATIPHPLGQKPGMGIVKNRTAADRGGQAQSWIVQHGALGATKRLLLNDTGAAAATSLLWNDTEPSSTLFTIGNYTAVNYPGDSFVLYLFANTDAIKVGSYTGNGSTDGPFVDLGGEPLWVMMKRTDASGSWSINDGVRDPYNPSGTSIFPSSSTTETSGTAAGYNVFDFVANGVKLRQSTAGINASGATYIYLAFIDRYFGGANVAQGRAR